MSFCWTHFSRENSSRTKIILERIFKAGGLERSEGHRPGGDYSFIWLTIKIKMIVAKWIVTNVEVIQCHMWQKSKPGNKNSLQSNRLKSIISNSQFSKCWVMRREIQHRCQYWRRILEFLNFRIFRNPSFHVHSRYSMTKNCSFSTFSFKAFFEIFGQKVTIKIFSKC